MTKSHAATSEHSIAAGASAGAKVGPIGVETKLEGTQKVTDGTTKTEEYRLRKIDFLLRHIIDYQNLFQELGKLSGGDAFLFLDDLYHIPKRDQPDLIDYFHRIAKNNKLWVKVGTIPE